METKNSPQNTTLIPSERVISKIYVIQGKKVMLDRDLAELYGVETRVLIQAVKRSMKRFPEDFMFQLSREEFDNLKSQIVISSWGGTRKRSYAFTEQGVAMLSSVLNSERAILVNIQIIRAFTKLREILLTHKELRDKIEKMESKYDKQFQIVFTAIKKLLDPKIIPKREIGFKDKNK